MARPPASPAAIAAISGSSKVPETAPGIKWSRAATACLTGILTVLTIDINQANSTDEAILDE